MFVARIEDDCIVIADFLVATDFESHLRSCLEINLPKELKRKFTCARVSFRK